MVFTPTKIVPAFKVWDNTRHEMLMWKKIKSGTSANYTFANDDNSYRIGWSAIEYPNRYKFCFSLGQKDKHGTILYSGDLVVNSDSEVGEIKWDSQYARFIVHLVIGETRILETAEIEKIGDIYHVKNKVS